MVSSFQGRAYQDGVLREFRIRVLILGHWVDNPQNPERMQIEKEIFKYDPLNVQRNPERISTSF
jgi:hypothetical protein